MKKEAHMHNNDINKHSDLFTEKWAFVKIDNVGLWIESSNNTDATLSKKVFKP